MTKRATGAYSRRDMDFYPTPAAAIDPVIPHLKRTGVKRFAEPCYGDGAMALHLVSEGFIMMKSGDINDANATDARGWSPEDYQGVDAVVTNPPWEAATMMGIMEHQSTFVPAWFLIYSDWIFTKQSWHLMKTRCTDVVPIGRVKWFPESKSVGFDNCCWIRLSPTKPDDMPTFFWPMQP